MSRNYLLSFLFAIGILANYSCKKDIGGCTNRYSFNYNPSATESDNSCTDMGNCMGYVGNLGNSGSIINGLGNPFYDQKMGNEVAIQSNFFYGIPATVYILLEPSVEYKNAYARPDGIILFGYYMHYYTIQTYGELPVAGVLAHEWGHRVQQTLNWQDYYRPEHRELEADAFSGFYMALRKQWTWSQIQGYFNNVYATGNYLYNNPDFHGTPEQRLKAAYLGVNVGINALTNGIVYTHNNLHSIFFTEIKNNIAPRNLPNAYYPEVVYPKNLTENYIRSLYPRR